jgi:hypothetical protein
MDYVTGLLVVGGSALHFLGSWGEEWRKQGRIGVLAFIDLERPKWIAAGVAAAISYAVLPQIGPMLGVEPPLGAVAAGYAANSLGAKVAALGKRG